MKSKILMISLLAITFVFANNACAVGQNNENTMDKNLQGQQGEEVQMQTQQILLDDKQGRSTSTPNQIQNQEEMQNQNQTGLVVAEQRRSQIANAVQTMLQVAERNSGIGEQVRIIAQAQTQNQEQLESSLEKVQKRNEFIKLFFGPDYDEINKAEEVLVQNREQIGQLSQIKNELTNQTDQQALTQQIQMLEQANLEIENSLGNEKKGFSLLGWVFKMFSN